MFAKSFVLSFFIALIIGCLAYFFSFQVACFLVPPRIVDVDGEVHGLMPLGQFIVACIVGIMVAIMAWVISYKKIHRHFLSK